MRQSSLPIVLMFVLVCWFSPVALAGAEEVDYRQQIEPILRAHCYDCHAADVTESDLRLDHIPAAVEGGNSGPAIVPGKSGASLLIERIMAEPAERMPPEGEGEPLTAAQIELLRKWIDQGAKAPHEEAITRERRSSDHWAFQPIVRPELPPVEQADWCRSPIDRFILARLEAEGIAPSPEADPVTLLRRVHLDLIGLPPTLAEVESFLADTHPKAYERRVERLLASPQYGERWARHWLDYARYADSDGYTNDVPRSIWPYRDWVIAALNRDQPFDEFTIDQIAGDLHPDPTPEQIIATGFHRNTQHNREGGSDPEQYRVERVVDRVSTTGTVFLGLTIACARCHDHKFDPISQREFFELYAFFDSCDEPNYRIVSAAQEQRRTALQTELAEAEQRLREYDQQLTPKQAEWERQLAATKPVQWTTLEPYKYESARGAKLTLLNDHSLLALGTIPVGDDYTIRGLLPFSGVTAIRLEALTHNDLPNRGPGLAPHGNFVLSQLVGTAKSAGKERISVKFAGAWADHSQVDYPVTDALDPAPEKGWAINVRAGEGSLNTDRQAIFFLNEPLAAEELTLELKQHLPNAKPYQIGRFRLSVTRASRQEIEASLLGETAWAALAEIAPEKRTPQQRKQLEEAFHASDSARKQLDFEVNQLKEAIQKFEQSLPTTLVLRQRRQPRESYIHVRGDFLSKGRTVEPGVLGVLPPLAESDQPPSRMDLARWIVDEQNPLTARVIMNRFWQVYFGIGLVETDEDFGTQGEPPTHPELLDWLASEFIAQKWSMKQMHRAIVTSAAYRQASAARPELLARDPRNRLLARQSRHRLEAEVIRDTTLRAAGLLSLKMGGPGVYPPQPEGVMNLARSAGRKWIVSTGEDRYRRGLYTYFWRGTPHPFLKTFDAPDSNQSCTRRDRSNTPLQALTLLNDEAFFEAAQGLAARVLREVPTDDLAQLRHAFQLCLLREPSERELTILAELLAAERRDAARRDAKEVEEPLTTPAAEGFPAQVSSAERIAWTSVARALLNVDEFITRE